MNEYRVEVRVKNNLLINMMKKHGLNSQAELARSIGVNTTAVCNIVSLKESAYNKDGQMRVMATRLCDYFCCFPEEIYPAQVLFSSCNKNMVVREVSYDELSAITEQEELNPLNILIEGSQEDYLGGVMEKRLTEREQKVIKMRFGVGMNSDHYLGEVAGALGVSCERVREIEAKALRKLRGMASRHAKTVDRYEEVKGMDAAGMCEFLVDAADNMFIQA